MNEINTPFTAQEENNEKIPTSPGQKEIKAEYAEFKLQLQKQENDRNDRENESKAQLTIILENQEKSTAQLTLFLQNQENDRIRRENESNELKSQVQKQENDRIDREEFKLHLQKQESDRKDRESTNENARNAKAIETDNNLMEKFGKLDLKLNNTLQKVSLNEISLSNYITSVSNNDSRQSADLDAKVEIKSVPPQVIDAIPDPTTLEIKPKFKANVGIHDSQDYRRHTNNDAYDYDEKQKDTLFDAISDTTNSDHKDKTDYKFHKPPTTPHNSMRRSTDFFAEKVIKSTHLIPPSNSKQQDNDNNNPNYAYNASSQHNNQPQPQMLFSPASDTLQLEYLTLPKLIQFISAFKKLQQHHRHEILNMGDRLSTTVMSMMVDISNDEDQIPGGLNRFYTGTTLNIPNTDCMDLLLRIVAPRNSIRFKQFFTYNLKFPYLNPKYFLSITNYTPMYNALLAFRETFNNLWDVLVSTAAENPHIIPVLFREGQEPGLFDIFAEAIPQGHGVSVLKMIDYKRLKQMPDMGTFINEMYIRFHKIHRHSLTSQDWNCSLRIPDKTPPFNRNDASTPDNSNNNTTTPYRTPTSGNVSSRFPPHNNSQNTGHDNNRSNNKTSFPDNRSMNNINYPPRSDNSRDDRDLGYEDDYCYAPRPDNYNNHSTLLAFTNANESYQDINTDHDPYDAYNAYPDQYSDDIRGDNPDKIQDHPHNDTSRGSLNAIELDRSSKAKLPCFDHMLNGTCQKSKCNYSHDINDLRMGLAEHKRKIAAIDHLYGPIPPSSNNNNPIRDNPKKILSRPSNLNLHDSGNTPSHQLQE